MAFPGERCVEVVDCVCTLLHPDRSSLENFEALLALTNLATVGSSVRRKMINEHYADIEHMMFEDHDMIRRAATEVICNLACEDECVKKFEPENDRVKMMVALCGEDDLLLNRAAAGALCQLSSASRIVCEKALGIKSFFDIFKQITTAEDAELQFRAFYILRNMMSVEQNDHEIAKSIVASELMDVIMAMSKFSVQGTKEEEQKRKRVVDVANDITKYCLENQFIKPGTAAFTA